MGKSYIDYKDLTKLAELLNMGNNPNELEEYLNGLDNSKMISIYNRLNSKVSFKKTIKYMNLILDLTNFEITDALAEELLMDEGLQEYLLNVNLDNIKDNKFLKVLNENINKTMEAEKDISSYDDDVKDYPVYEEDEEKDVFRNYKAWKKELEKYILHNYYLEKILGNRIDRHDYIDFVEYVTSLDNTYAHDTKEFLMMNAVSKLYSPTCDEECVINIKKDPIIMGIIDQCMELRDDIVNHNYRLTVACSKKYESFALPIKDLIQESNIGLIKAIERFDVYRGNKFSTYAVWWINQSIKRALANDSTTIRIPVWLYELKNKANKVIKVLREQDGIEEPNPEQLYEKCKEFGYDFTFEQVVEILNAKKKSEPFSTDKAVGEDEDSSLIDFLYDENYSVEAYAEFMELKEKADKCLKLIAQGLTPKGNPYKGANNKIYFKKVNFVTTEGKDIIILLTMKEFEHYIKNIKEEGGRDRFIEFLKLYKLDPNKLTSYYNFSNFIMTNGEREALVYRLRYGIPDDYANMFVDLRNYNNALFEEDTERYEFTLEKVGKLLGVTRERVRQLESKAEKKIDPNAKRRIGQAQTTQYLYMDEKQENIYDLFNISVRSEYIPIIPKNDVIKVDIDYNITLLKPGVVKVVLKNVKYGGERELTLVIRPSLKETLKNERNYYPKMNILRLDNNKKDNQ